MRWSGEYSMSNNCRLSFRAEAWGGSKAPLCSFFLLSKNVLKLWVGWFYFIFSFNGKFTFPLVCMNKLRDLEAYVEFVQSPVKCKGSGNMWFPFTREVM